MLSEVQHSFQKGYSTELAITEFTDNMRLAMDRGKMTGAVFIDLQKAFDMVDNRLSLSKLPLKGIIGHELNWIANYLSDGCQYVHYDGIRSDQVPVQYGVQRGSVLESLLFLLLIDILIKSVKNCSIQLYANDTVIYTSGSEISVIEQTLTSEVNNISRWLDKNRLIIDLKRGNTESLLFGTAKRLSSKIQCKCM